MKIRYLFFVFSILLVMMASQAGSIFINETKPATMARSSSFTGISLDGKAITMVMDGKAILKDCFVTFNYAVQDQPAIYNFSSSVTSVTLSNSSIQDTLGAGTRYIITYKSANITVVLQASMYPSSASVIANATIIPAVNITFQGDFGEFSTSTVDVLPFVASDARKFSYFEGDSIWSDYTLKDSNAMVWWARTPFLVHGTSDGLLVGALTSNNFETQVSNMQGVFSITNTFIHGLQARASKNLSTEIAWLQYGGNFSGLFLNYADEVKAYNPPARNPRVVENIFSKGAGECDWYSHYANINEQTVLAELGKLSSLTNAGYKYYIMDDGWGSNQSLHYYNWSSWDAVKFPNGIAPCVQKAHDTGIKFVLWNRIDYAPTWVVQNHPDWCAAIDSNDLSNSVLNISLPAVQAYMNAVFATWKSEGIDGLKVDFIIASMYWTWSAPAWNLNMTRTWYVNLYFDTLDKLAARYNLTILLCGTPYGYPSLARYVNLVASRVTGDTQPQGGLQTKEIATALTRSFWWARAFNTPDPDAYNTRDIRGLMVAASVGGALYHGNDYLHLKVDDAKLAWKIHWDKPAIPDNICFNGNLIIARGTWSGYQVVIAANIDEQKIRSFTIDGLRADASAILVSDMCSVDGINGQYDMTLEPGRAEMLIVYADEPPFAVLPCREIQVLFFACVLIIPLCILGLSVAVQFRKTIHDKFHAKPGRRVAIKS